MPGLDAEMVEQVLPRSRHSVTSRTRRQPLGARCACPVADTGPCSSTSACSGG